MAPSTLSVPQQQTVPFQPAEYHQPLSKGMQIALGALSLIFGDRGIGQAAAGYMGGANQAAAQRYEREEKAAEQQYRTAEDAAETDYRNQAARYNADLETRKLSYENAVERYKAAQDLRVRGIDPRTNQPFVIPQQLQRILPPGSNRAPQYSDYANHERQLAAFYQSVGATDLVAQHDASAKEYDAEAKQQQQDALRIQLAVYHEQNESARSERGIAARWSEHADSEAWENYRAALKQQREDDDPRKKAEWSSQATRAASGWYTSWAKATKAPTGADGQPKVDDKGNPLPAAIDPTLAASLTKAFSRIDNSEDPQGAATWYAGQVSTGNATATSLLQERATVANLTRRSRGQLVVPGSFTPPPMPKTPALPPLPNVMTPELQAKIDTLPADVRAAISAARAKGMTLEAIRQNAIDHNTQVVVDALTPGPSTLTLPKSEPTMQGTNPLVHRLEQMEHSVRQLVGGGQ
jgi:hypothetical protein